MAPLKFYSKVKNKKWSYFQLILSLCVHFIFSKPVCLSNEVILAIAKSNISIVF